ncbi:MAG: ZIP family metal transporter [Cyanobacteria bacterium]|nr:ZIP family metal transporter [Cyanobacteriota bacterium]MDW8199672.1 ZIP family metal transporter [Cyanobacteriota bacterium SKYGB_h_bin112]
MNSFILGIQASLLAGLATFVGALPVVLTQKLSQRAITVLLGFGGGVMLAATAFSLIIPGTEVALAKGFSNPVAALVMAIGLTIGGAFLAVAHRLFPHEHFVKGKDGSSNLARVWLFIIAIALHNFPEGLAVGVSFGGDNVQQGIITAIGISLQNMPEGLIVAVSLVAEGYTVAYALGISLLTALVEPIGGVIGVSVVSLAQFILPWALAFAAGAMLFVICDEIIPETHQRGKEHEGTIGIIAGFLVMMVLDIAFS